MRDTTVCYLLDDDKVLLGYKKRGFGEGKFTGIGGKIEEDETPLEAVIREIWEEIQIKIRPEYLEYRGKVHYSFTTRPEWNMTMNIFTTRSWEGIPIEGDEVIPDWFPVDNLPFDQMWPDAKLWMDQIFRDGTIEFDFNYTE